MISINNIWDSPEEHVYINYVPVDKKIEQGVPIKYYVFDCKENIEFYLESLINNRIACVIENIGYGNVYIYHGEEQKWSLDGGTKIVLEFINGNWYSK